MTVRTALLARVCVAFAAAVFAVACMVPAALADEVEQSDSPCVLTDEQRAQYAADGTLEERLEFAESLNHDAPSEELIAQANGDAQSDALPATGDEPNAAGNSSDLGPKLMGGESSLPTSGEAHVLGLHVSFTDMQFEEGDTVEALQDLIGKSIDNADAAPVEGSLSDFYAKSSYGKLNISGEAYEYAAEHERSYYDNDHEKLFKEALAALDSIIDFMRFDANNDGRIDTVYLHFAGPNSGWMSTWWSVTSSCLNSEGAVFDGKRFATYVTLHEASNTDEGLKTVKHETGHALGLPDYYSYGVNQTFDSTSGRVQGIGTWDMMFNNTGDHNGFSKWMLGWLSDDQITRVMANENGITVKDGGSTVSYAPGQSVDFVIEALSQDSLEAGKIIVVSNEDKGPFSSCYLIQYDRYAGLQKVSYVDIDAVGTKHEIPSAFRVFRVQAELGENGMVAHTNSYGVVNNQLLEMVDPDVSLRHGFSGDLFRSIGDVFHCLFMQGDVFSPLSMPSTNLYENIASGFTGLSFEAVETGGAAGTLRISWSDADKPELLELELAAPVTGIQGGGTKFVITANRDLVKGTIGYPPNLLVDGSVREHRPALYEISGNTITLVYDLDVTELKAGTQCTLVFMAGSFVLNGGKLSEKIELKIAGGNAIVPIVESGNYDNVPLLDKPIHLSEIVEAGETERVFFGMDGNVLTMYTLDVRQPNQVVPQEIAGFDRPLKARCIYSCALLENGTYRILLSEGSLYSNTGWFLIVDPKQLKVAAWGDSWQDIPVEETREFWRLPEYEWLGGEYSADLLAIERLQDTTWILYTPEYDALPLLAEFDKAGTLLRSVEVNFDGAVIRRADEKEKLCYRIDVAPNGSIATTFYYTGTNFEVRPQISNLYDANLNFKGRLAAYGTGTCLWLEDNRFMAIGERVTTNAGVGAPLLAPAPYEVPETRVLVYDITMPITVAVPQDDPQPKPASFENPESITVSATPAGAVRTSDSAAAFFLLLTALLALAATLLLAPRRHREVTKGQSLRNAK